MEQKVKDIFIEYFNSRFEHLMTIRFISQSLTS